MSLSSALRRAAAPAALAVATAFAAANANAAPTLEPASMDLTKPVVAGGCFYTNESGTALAKLSAVMNARNQIVVATGNQAVRAKAGESPYAGMIFSASQDGKEGYEISIDVPKEQMASAKSACAVSLQAINIYNVNTLTAVPPEVNKGELGVGLRNAHATGMKVFMTAVSRGGAILAVNFDPKAGIGSIVSADANGNKAGILGNMASVAYTKKAQELLQIAEAPNGTVGTVALATYKPTQP